MNKKGFTLVEILATITILAIIMLGVATNFFGLIGSQEKFETKELYKYLNDAAYVYSIKNNVSYVDVKTLLEEGYIENSYGILKDSNIESTCSNENDCIIQINTVDGEKSACVYKYNREIVSGEETCKNE